MANIFNEGTIIISPKYGKGVIDKIITKSTGYALIKFDNGVERKMLKKCSNLTFEDGTPCFTGKKQVKLSKQEKDQRDLDKFNAKTNLQKIKSSLISGSYYKSGISYEIWLESVYVIESKAKETNNKYVQNIIKTVLRYNKVSEKQAYVIARFADDNGLMYGENSHSKSWIVLDNYQTEPEPSKKDKEPINTLKQKNQMYKIKESINNGLVISKLSDKTKKSIKNIRTLSDDFTTENETAKKLDDLLFKAPSVLKDIKSAMPTKIKVVKPKKDKVVKLVKKSENQTKTPAYYKQEIKKIKQKLSEFIPELELETLLTNAKVMCIKNKPCEFAQEEGEYFAKILIEFAEKWDKVPKFYETEEIPTEEQIVWLHYFVNGSDWYVIERDNDGTNDRAYGYAILNGDTQNAEFGYIDLKAIKTQTFQYGIQAELDLHFDPITIKELFKNKGISTNHIEVEDFEETDENIGLDLGVDLDYYAEAFDGDQQMPINQLKEKTSSYPNIEIHYNNEFGKELRKYLQTEKIKVSSGMFVNAFEIQFNSKKATILDNEQEFHVRDDNGIVVLKIPFKDYDSFKDLCKGTSRIIQDYFGLEDLQTIAKKHSFDKIMSIKLLWDELDGDDLNTKFKDFQALQNNYERITEVPSDGTYFKSKLSIEMKNSEGEIFISTPRIYVSKEDFNPFKQDILSHLKEHYNSEEFKQDNPNIKIDLSDYSAKVVEKEKPTKKPTEKQEYIDAIEGLELMYETTGEQSYKDAIEGLKLMI